MEVVVLHFDLAIADLAHQIEELGVPHLIAGVVLDQVQQLAGCAGEFVGVFGVLVGGAVRLFDVIDGVGADGELLVRLLDFDAVGVVDFVGLRLGLVKLLFGLVEGVLEGGFEVSVGELEVLMCLLLGVVGLLGLHALPG